jgi:hypothetical protein
MTLSNSRLINIVEINRLTIFFVCLHFVQFQNILITLLWYDLGVRHHSNKISANSEKKIQLHINHSVAIIMFRPLHVQLNNRVPGKLLF